MKLIVIIGIIVLVASYLYNDYLHKEEIKNILQNRDNHDSLNNINSAYSGIGDDSNNQNSKQIFQRGIYTSSTELEIQQLNIKYSDTVKHALKNKLPIVSLESTIISHGMPYPQNYHTAKAVEDIVRENGVVPATIAIINGTIHIGLNDDEIHYLSKVGKVAVKTSRRDLALVTAQKLTGSTTVSATIFLSNLVGIKIFVTGGLGGVHRGAETSMDISADLTELGKNGVMVVSAGVKSILDIGKTLEYLETQGVTVISFGTNEFPAFFTKTSGFKSPNRLDTPIDIAGVLYSNQKLRLNSGIVIAVPNNNEDSPEINKAIQDSIEQAEREKILGKDITPFLLAKVNEKTKGKSLEFNIMLIKNNARIGSLIAVEYNKICKQKQAEKASAAAATQESSSLVVLQRYLPLSLHKYLPYFQTKRIVSPPTPSSLASASEHRHKVVVLGGAVLDMISHPYKDSGFKLKTSNPGHLSTKMGGVGRNIAEVLARMNFHPLFISLVGQDIHSKVILDHFHSIYLSTRGIKTSATFKTAIYNAIMDNRGDLAVAIAQMDIFDGINPSLIKEFAQEIQEAKMIVLDGNLPIESFQYIDQLVSTNKNIQVWFEPTSVFKSTKPILASTLSMITYTSPNKDELIHMSSMIIKQNPKLSVYLDNLTDPSNDKNIDTLKAHTKVLLASGIQHVITKLGPDGVLLGYQQNNLAVAEQDKFVFESFPAPPVDNIIDVTGAGDSLVGCVIYALQHLGKDLQTSISKYGSKCAEASLLSSDPISNKLSPHLFE